MKKYYIIRADGSSIFEQSYPEDFIFHCLINLIDSSDEAYRLLSFNESSKLTMVYDEYTLLCIG